MPMTPAQRKENSIAYFKRVWMHVPGGDINPRRIATRLIRRGPRRSLYAVMLIDNGMIREVSGNVSFVTGEKWNNSDGGIWTSDELRYRGAGPRALQRSTGNSSRPPVMDWMGLVPKG